jgi:hypothetical protein
MSVVLCNPKLFISPVIKTPISGSSSAHPLYFFLYPRIRLGVKMSALQVKAASTPASRTRTYPLPSPSRSPCSACPAPWPVFLDSCQLSALGSQQLCGSYCMADALPSARAGLLFVTGKAPSDNKLMADG